MDAASLRAVVEAEWTWRADELRFLKNQLSTIGDQNQQDIYRKTLVVMLYSHFEGFCKAAFTAYIQALNADECPLQDVVAALVASGLVDLFNDLRNSERKSAIFRVTAPDDSGLHRDARNQEFVQRWSEFLGATLRLNEETIVDTESNLKPVVLRKIMFRLGLRHEGVDEWAGDISHLLGRRNEVAHGVYRSGIDETTFAKLERAVTSVVNLIAIELFGATVACSHLRVAARS